MCVYQVFQFHIELPDMEEFELVLLENILFDFCRSHNFCFFNNKLPTWHMFATPAYIYSYISLFGVQHCPNFVQNAGYKNRMIFSDWPLTVHFIIPSTRDFLGLVGVIPLSKFFVVWAPSVTAILFFVNVICRLKYYVSGHHENRDSFSISRLRTALQTWILRKSACRLLVEYIGVLQTLLFAILTSYLVLFHLVGHEFILRKTSSYYTYGNHPQWADIFPPSPLPSCDTHHRLCSYEQEDGMD